MSSEDGTLACSKVVVAASSHRRSRGLIPRGSQILAAKQTPFRRSTIVIYQFINFDIVNPFSKSNGGRGRMSDFIFGGAGSVLFVSGWVAMAWSKVLFRAS